MKSWPTRWASLMEANTRSTQDAVAEGEGPALGESVSLGLGVFGEVPLEGDGPAVDEDALLHPMATSPTTATSAGRLRRTMPS